MKYMKTTALNYRIIVEHEHLEKNAVYVAYAPSLGVSDFGETIEKAVLNIEQAIKLYLETLVDLQQPIPDADTGDYYVTTRSITLDKVAHA